VVDFHGLMGKIDQSNRRVAFAHDHG